MRLPLERKESKCLKLIYNDKISGEESCELVIPDTCGDVGKILDVRGQVLVTGKKAFENSVCVSAAVEADVLFLAEDMETVHHVSAKLPFELSAVVNGAGEDSYLLAETCLCGIDARMLNPRKLLIRGELLADVRCYNPDIFVLWQTGEFEKELGIRLQSRQLSHSLVTDIGEKSFTLSDEYALPKNGDSPAKLLSCVTGLCVNEVKTVGSKLIFKAVAETNAVFIDSEGDVFSSVFETQFSQIIESDSAQNEPLVDIIPYLTSSDFVLLPDREEGVIAANFKISVQAICIVTTTSDYIADAYSCRYPLEAEKAQVPVFLANTGGKQKLRLEGSFGEENCELIYAYCAGVCTDTAEGKVCFRTEIRGVGKTQEGMLTPLSASLKGCEEFMPEPHRRPDVINLCCGPLTVTQNGSICLDLFYDLVIFENGELSAVCSLEIDSDRPLDFDRRPSLVVLCGDLGTDLWSIAKKYCSDIDAIVAANSLCSEFSEGMRPLIVPKI